jgi:nitrite reductase/ring-hydroxylating ferredoxin subunit
VIQEAGVGRWVEVAKRGELPPGRGRSLQAGGRFIALYNDGGTFFAIDDTCPHQGASLGEGILHEGTVICPWHAWSFSLRTGVSPHVPELAVACYPTRLEGDAVEVELPEETG